MNSTKRKYNKNTNLSNTKNTVLSLLKIKPKQRKKKQFVKLDRSNVSMSEGRSEVGLNLPGFSKHYFNYFNAEMHKYLHLTPSLGCVCLADESCDLTPMNSLYDSQQFKESSDFQ